MRKRTLQLAALATVLLLGGCWVSEQPLITPANSNEPLAAGDYLYHTEGEDSPLTLRKFPGGGYLYALDDETAPVLAHRIAEDWYVLETGVEGEPLLYGVGRLSPGRFDIYDPECTEEVLAIPGVADDDGDCSFTTLKALAAAGRIAKRQIEAGEDIRLTGWLEPAPATQP